MSSRVQKGNTVFKPVVKSRARTVAPFASRQESVVLPLFPESPTVGKSPQKPGTVVAPSVAAPATNDVIPLTKSQTTASVLNIIPTIISSRLPPPVLLQVDPCSSINVQSPLSVEVSAEHPLTDPQTSQPTNVNQNTPEVTSMDFPGSSSTLFLPMATPSPPMSPIFGEGPSVMHDGSSKTRRDESGKESKTRRISKLGEGKTPEREKSPSDPKSNKTPRPRRRVPSVPPFDPDADPGEDIDPTAVTMASLCVDSGQGRISTKAAEIVNNHAAWKLKNREKRARMRAVMEAKKYGRSDDEADDSPEKSNAAEVLQPPTLAVTANTSIAAAADDTGNGFDYSQELTASRYNVQVRIGPNGETVIDEDSLVVDRTENQGTENFTHVTESDYTKFVNSATYGKRFRGSRWSAEETELFYDALSQYGENYELLAYVLPGRDRKACKNKFKAEDKKNSARISYCLDNRIPVDISTLSRMTGKDFSGPVPEIRPPQQPQPVTGDEQVETAQDASPNEGSSKKRSHSKSRDVSDGNVIVIGNQLFGCNNT